MIPRVLVTDGGERAALACVRALGRAGFPVDVCASRSPSLASASRYCQRAVHVPDPLVDTGAFVAAIEQLVAQWQPNVVLPISEQSLRCVLPLRLADRGVAVPFPPLSAFAAISDKQQALASAAAVGMLVPQQRVVRTVAEVPDAAAWELPFPVVVKPTRSVVELGASALKVGVSYANDGRALTTQLHSLPHAAFPVLVQQRVVGPGIGVFLLRWNGEFLARFAHRRLREKPPAGGVSVYRESIALDPDLYRRAQELLERFDWRGVAMVELKVETQSGNAYLMEVNGRLWGSLQLAIDAGVDFPVLLVRAALGDPAPIVTTYRIGVRSRWWWGDVDHLIARLRQSREALALPPDAPGRSRALIDFLKLWRPGDRPEVFRWEDPRPFLQETLDWVRRR